MPVLKYFNRCEKLSLLKNYMRPRRVRFCVLMTLAILELIIFGIFFKNASEEEGNPGVYVHGESNGRVFDKSPLISSLTYNCSSMGIVPNCLTKRINVTVHPDRTLCDAENITLLVIIITTRGHEWRRSIVRENFRRQQYLTQHSIRLVFLLGHQPQSEQTMFSNPERSRKQLDQEAKFYGDILQGDFIDVYPNNTLKAIFAMQWYQQYCSNARFFMKADDDMSLNLGPMLDYVAADVSTNTSLRRFVLGRCDLSRNIYHYRYILKLKNRLPETIYPDDYIPQYCAGGAYLLPAEVVSDLLIAVWWVPLVYVEDIYLGIVIARLKYPVTILNRQEFLMGYNTLQYPSLCRKLRAGAVFAIHNKHAEGLEYFARECYPSLKKN